MKYIVLGASDASYLEAERKEGSKKTYNAQIRNIMSLANQNGWQIIVAGQHWT